MPATLHLMPALIARIERFGAEFHAARMGAAAALPSNPFGIDVRRFPGGAVAVRVRSPLLRGKNRVIGFTTADADALDDILALYRDEGLPFSLAVPHGQMTPDLFRRLADAGLWSAGSGSTPVVAAGEAADSPSSPPNLVIRPSGAEERELYLDLFQRAFTDRAEQTPEYRAFQWAEDSLPGGVRCVAEWDGEPVGMASFIARDGIGYCGTAGVAPEFRGRGIQSALIRRRLADAPSLGCDLVMGGGSPGTTTYRNFERAGMRVVPLGLSWGGVPSSASR